MAWVVKSKFGQGVWNFGFRDARAGSLKDHEIAAVLTYIRNSWDNKAPAIWPQDIAAARKKLTAHGSMSAKELEEVQDFSDPGAKSKASEGGTIPKP